MTYRHLTVREWLEAERLTGLPHADFAAEALGQLDQLEDYENADTPVANDTLEEIATHVADCEGADTAGKVKWAVKQLDALIDIHGGEYGTIVERVEEADLRWWDIWDVLVGAGVVGRNDPVSEVDVPSLMRMFLPT